jgi:hypothetical protein
MAVHNNLEGMLKKEILLVAYCKALSENVLKVAEENHETAQSRSRPHRRYLLSNSTENELEILTTILQYSAVKSSHCSTWRLG